MAGVKVLLLEYLWDFSPVQIGYAIILYGLRIAHVSGKMTLYFTIYTMTSKYNPR